MTKTIQSTLSKFAGQSRPLRTLTKEELFVYPQADPSVEAGFKFAREVIHRRQVFGKAVESVELAKGRLEDAHMKMVRNAHESKAPYEKQIALRKRELATAEAALAALPADDQALSHAEVAAHFRGKHLDEYQQQIRRWEKRELFEAQRFGWLAFITCDSETRRSDDQVYHVVETLAAFCGEEKSPVFLEIMSMWISRIAPSMRMRRRFLDVDGQPHAPASLDKDMQETYWKEWRAYNTLTFTHKWDDDSGVAFDDRIFKMTPKEED